MNVTIRQLANEAAGEEATAAEMHSASECAAAEVPAAAWYDVEAHWAEPNIFNGRDFALAYSEAFGLDGRLRALRFETGDGRLDGLFLFRRRLRWGVPFGVAEGLISPFSGSSVPLVRTGFEAAVAARFVHAMKAGEAGERPWMLPVMPTDGRVTEAILEAAARDGVAAIWFDRHRRPVVEPTGAPKDDFPVIGAGRLRKYRQLGRRLNGQGEVQVETVRDRDAVARRVETFLEIEAAGWKGELGTAAAMNPAHAALFRKAIPALAERGQCRIDTLFLDGRPIAIGITPEGPGAAWFWKVAYDEAFGRFSPYMQLLIRQTTEIVETGHPTYVDSCAKTAIGPVERVWHQRREFGDLLLVPQDGLPSPSVAAFLERGRRSAREGAVALRDAVRARLKPVRPAPGGAA